MGGAKTKGLDGDDPAIEDRKAKMQEIITLLEEYESQGF